MRRYLDPAQLLTHVPKWPLYTFAASAIFCLSGSTFCHTCFILSEDWCSFLQRLDYTGIAVLIFGSLFPPLQYFLACQQFDSLRYFYMSAMTICSTIVVVMSLTTFFL